MLPQNLHRMLDAGRGEVRKIERSAERRHVHGERWVEYAATRASRRSACRLEHSDRRTVVLSAALRIERRRCRRHVEISRWPLRARPGRELIEDLERGDDGVVRAVELEVDELEQRAPNVQPEARLAVLQRHTGWRAGEVDCRSRLRLHDLLDERLGRGLRERPAARAAPAQYDEAGGD